MSAMLRRAGPMLALAALVILARAVLVGGFASALPFWDQWDAEAASWLKPWLQGELTFAHLLAAHNEHRIGWSRLWSLLWFEANGGRWDNLVLALANTLLSGLLAALTWALLRDGLATRAARAVFFALVLLLAVMPFGWENLLVGFQSQFQFLALFALLLLAAAARLRDRPASLPLLWGLALLGLPTMATGVLAPVAAGGVLVLRVWAGQWRIGRAGVAVAGLAVIALGGLAAVPVVPEHGVLRPDSLAEGLRALGRVLAWPVPRGWWVVPALWLPTAWALWQFRRRREVEAQEWLALGLAAWTLLQALAIVWSRGQGLEMPPSRYTDLLAFGLLANGWLALQGWERARTNSGDGRWLRAAPAALVLLYFAALLAGLVRGLPAHRVALHERSWLSGEQRANVREFLASGEPQALVAPPLYVPYPDPARLAAYLSDPVIVAMLPATINDRADAALGALASRWREAVRRRVHPAQPTHPDAARRWRLPVADGPAQALQVTTGVEMVLELPAPRAGKLVSVALQLGTYGLSLPGQLEMQACRGSDCVMARSALATAQDNKDLELRFERPLPLLAGEPLRLRLGAKDTGHPVVVWLVPARQDGVTLAVRTAGGERGDLSGHAPRLVLRLLP
jgi:hypothetical protein